MPHPDGQPSGKVGADYAEYYDLGTHHRTVTTSNKDAQIWFDRGLIWSYAFNHEEATECFQRAVVHDPKCAMAYWGIAYAVGPNYNKPWEFFDAKDLAVTVTRAHEAVTQAKANIMAASPVEQSLIEALQFRYPQKEADGDCKTDIWNKEYAEAMARVYDQFPDDLDVAALYSDSLMNLTPWKFWDLRTGQPSPNAHSLKIKRVLERALSADGGIQHPGLLHFYIHLMEMSQTPEVAMTVADHLRGLVPDSGHLRHMPTHIDILCGEYRRAIASNRDANRADEKFLARAGPLNFYTLYRSHDYHFIIYAALFCGQSKAALDCVTKLEKTIPEELLRVQSPPMGDWLESFVSMRVHIYIRFGRWQDVLDIPLPVDQQFYCYTTAVLHYGRGLAHSATGKIQEAEKEQALFREATARVLPSRRLFNNTCTDILAVAEAMLNGELEYRRGNFEQAFESLRKAISLDDGLPYDEPWGWMQPTRHAYGALLLEQGHVEEAAAVYSADLGMDNSLPRARHHPNNVWSLHGFHECLMKLGRTAEARILEPQLKLAVAVADVPIKASCFCRLSSCCS